MFRVLITLFLLSFFRPLIQAQTPSPKNIFKSGDFPSRSGLQNRKISDPLWFASRFRQNYYVVVQMDQIPDNERRLELLGAGIRLTSYISANHYLAICRSGFDLESTSALGVKNIYSIPVSMKWSPSISPDGSHPNGPKDLIALSCFPVDRETAKAAIRAAGAQIVETKIKPANTWFVKAPAKTIRDLASLPFVHSISALHLEDVALNYNNRAAHAVHALAATMGRNLHGKNMIVGIGDNADPSGHIDLAGKLILRTDEPIDAHGTHTSGTIAGGGILNPLYAGMAPAARLVMNDFSNIIVNSPTYVHDYNIPLTNNSYYNGAAACPGDGDYNVLSYYVDSQMLAYPKLLHVFAAGNDGFFTCSPFPYQFGTIKSGFQTAKNLVTVGSMDNSVYLVNGPSSRGPTSDGRIKPEIVAGGVGITSTVPFNSYATSNGTSMASPTVTGILTLVAERYRQLHGGANPDAALLKALLTNCADDLGNPGPDFTYGFGSINGRKMVEALEQNHYFQGAVANGSSQTFTIPTLPLGVYQVKVLLYWPDAPAVPEAAKTLVNDLDLVVTDPGGLFHRPMILDPSPANVNNNAAEGADHINNIEQVVVNAPASGNVTVTVKGTSIPSGPQPFYIVYEILPFSVTVEYPFGTETWVPGETETIRWTAYGGDPNPFTVEFSPDAGASWTLLSNNVPSTAKSFAWVVPPIVTHQAVIRVTRNGVGYTDTSDFPFTIINAPTLTVSNTCPGYVQCSWNSITGADAYQVMKFAGDSMQVVAQTTDTNWLATNLNKDSSYWFSVRAIDSGFPGRRAIAQNIIPNGGACTASSLNNDLVLDSLLVPVSGRQFTSSAPGLQRITLHVRNPGTIPCSAPISYSYQINGGPVVTEISAGPIAAASAAVLVFSVPDSYDFSAAGLYQIKTWIHSSADTIPQNDTLRVTIKTLRNDPLLLNPSFTEGFETALDQTWNQPVSGLDSLDRADFSNSGPNGRLNTFFNTGFARNGQRSLLLDVNEQGTNAADSVINTFNLSGYSASDQIWLDIYFKKQSPVPALPGNQIWIRGNDQSPWIPVKSLSDPTDAPGAYLKLNIDVTGTLAAAIPAQTISSSFQVKCGAEGKTPAASVNPGALPGGGISFDDFTLTNAQQDLSMRGLLQPALKNICALGKSEKITVLVRNYSTDSVFNTPVTYIVNTDTVTEIIPLLVPKDSLQYSFSKTADLSVYQSYHIKVWISSPADNYRNNDSSSDYYLQTTPQITSYPYLEGFENNNGYWYTNGQNDSWQWGHPAKTFIHKAANGSKAWVTSLTGNYNDNEYSFLYSPCFDLSSLTKPVLSFSHIFQTEDNCFCDFHWVEYSLDDSIWTLLGNTTSGINWYENPTANAWQLSDTNWHVSSYDIPVNPTKIRFRFVMYSDPGTNYEGVGIDDIHVFEKAPVFTDSLVTSFSQPVSGSQWIDFDKNGERIFSINPNGQNLGNTSLSVYRDTAAVRDTADQYYGGRSWVIQTEKPATAGVGVRYYFTDTEAVSLVHASGCASCLNAEDPYSVGITQYSSPVISEEDSILRNNSNGSYLFHKPQLDVQVIPNDNGYYAETTVQGFSEFWLNGGGIRQDHPLAAWLKDFTATRSQTLGYLNWTTWQETNALNYFIEKSTDSIHFYLISYTPAEPHPDTIHTYHYTDMNLLEGANYYRIVRRDNNFDSLLSPVRKIIYSKDTVLTIGVFPNPTTGGLQINTASSCREIQIFDVLGRELLDKAVQGLSQQLSIASFPRGVYFLKLFTDSGNKLIKLEKR